MTAEDNDYSYAAEEAIIKRLHKLSQVLEELSAFSALCLSPAQANHFMMTYFSRSCECQLDPLAPTRSLHLYSKLFMKNWATFTKL